MRVVYTTQSNNKRWSSTKAHIEIVPLCKCVTRSDMCRWQSKWDFISVESGHQS